MLLNHRRAGGYLVIDDPDPARGQPARQEFDTATCSHCQRVFKLAALHAVCSLCDKYVCRKCAELGICVPFEKRLEADEALRSYGI